MGSAIYCIVFDWCVKYVYIFCSCVDFAGAFIICLLCLCMCVCFKHHRRNDWVLNAGGGQVRYMFKVIADIEPRHNVITIAILNKVHRLSLIITLLLLMLLLLFCYLCHEEVKTFCGTSNNWFCIYRFFNATWL